MLSARVKSLAPAFKKFVNAPVAARAFSVNNILDSKEMAEETRYIRRMEARRQEELRANIERILSMEDSHEEKKKIVELLEKKDEKKGWIEKLGLDDWRYALPVGLMIGVPAVAKEWIIIDAEFLLTSSFLLFCASFYNHVGPLIAQALDTHIKESEDVFKSLDATAERQINESIAENKTALSLHEDFSNLYSLTDQLSAAQAEILNSQEEHKYREAVIRKLDSLYAIEEKASSAIRRRMLSTVQHDVLELFKNDRKAKDDALNQAINVLSGGANAKLGKDIVGAAFSSALSNYMADYQKQAPGSDPILVQLEKDIAAVSEAPEWSVKKENVYVSHPVF